MASAADTVQSSVVSDNAKSQCIRSRSSSRLLQSVSTAIRSAILQEYSNLLRQNQSAILAANSIDIELAAKTGLSDSLRSRLILTESKLLTLITGIEQLSSSIDPLNRLIGSRELTAGLILERRSVSIGVLLVIFESRPDALPQLAALSIKTGNSILLKGGSEAINSLKILHLLIVQAINTVTNNTINGEDLVCLLSNRSAVNELLLLDSNIDLVIPRGGSSLVEYIKTNTKIPVLAHGSGVCHIYIDSEADINKSLLIVLDSKIDYPSACNAMETLLIHYNHTISTDNNNNPSVAQQLINALQSAGVTVYTGPRAAVLYPELPIQTDLHTEYSSMACTIEIVNSTAEALLHIHSYGSAHTDCIITENPITAQSFINSLDSACCFINCSTRFADGYRFGLGAEVGISTGRLHARGPVGCEGLTTYKWILNSSSNLGHTLSQYNNKEWTYTHKQIQ